MPETGPGSIALTGRRVIAYLIDAGLAGLMGGVVNGMVRHPTEGVRAIAGLAAFVVMTGVLLSVSGQTIGMRLMKLRVVPIGRLRFSWPIAMGIRTLLLALFLPALFFDRDGRGWHDKAAGTAVVQS